MNLLAFKPSFLEELIKSGAIAEINRKHFQICIELKNGLTQEKIGENFDLSAKQIRNIKRSKCPNCGLPKGRMRKVI